MNPYGRTGCPTPPPHGTRARYQSLTAPCDCTRCRAANADYVLRRRKVRVRLRYGEQLRIPGT